MFGFFITIFDIFSVSYAISKIVTIQTNTFQVLKMYISRNDWENNIKTTKNTIFPTNVKNFLCFWNFVGFS